MKTRLEAAIGKTDAQEFYRLSIAVIKEVIAVVQRKSRGRVVPYWAIAEKDALEDSLWCSFDRIWTGEGGLGERIHHVFEELQKSHEQVIIIGSDSPQLTYRYLLNAVNTLENGRQEGVIGPCKDGGFVLFGSRKRINRTIWTSVIYSREDTLNKLCEKLNKVRFSYSLLQEQQDVDQYNDLEALLECFLTMGPEILPGQQSLYAWVNELLMEKKQFQCSKYPQLLTQVSFIIA